MYGGHVWRLITLIMEFACYPLLKGALIYAIENAPTVVGVATFVGAISATLMQGHEVTLFAQ
jgi:hypothetical protein